MEIKVTGANGPLELKYTENGENVGIDLVATSKVESEMFIEYGTNLKIELPEGYAGLLFPRSSLSNYHLCLANSVGLIDPSYRGEIKARFKKTTDRPWGSYYQIGDKVCQLVIMPYPKVKLVIVDELSDTSRGEGSFGSTGR